MPRRALLSASLALCVALCALVPRMAAADTRADFLRLIDRPRVALDAKEEAPVEKGGLVHLAFSYAVESGQRVPGLLVAPAAAPTATAAPVRRPVVISLHGTGGNKESQVTLLTQFAAAGFIAVAIDGRYHGARSHAGKGTADYNEAIVRTFRSGPGPEHPFYFDTVWDVARLIDWLVTRPDVDPARIGLIGFSKGGIETYLAAAADPRIAAAVACIGVQSFRWALDHDSWQARIGTIQAAFDAAAKHAGVAKPTAEFVRTFYDRVAPGIYGEFDGPAMLPLIAPRPLLAINGDSDPRTPLPGLAECTEAARAAYHAAGADEQFSVIIQPHTGHKVNPDSLATARAWLTRWLKP